MTELLDSLTNYSYTPLEGSRSFRLLRILPETKGSNEINCTMEHFDRGSDRCPSYTALSYAWGDIKITVPARLNGQIAFVTVNLQEALLNLRRLCSGVHFWIDALSINQNDIGERGHQVSQMREIYSEATNVISWLGQGNQGTVHLFEFIRKHAEGCTFIEGSSKKCAFVADRELSDAIYDVDQRPYWHRLWVIQEIVVAAKLEVMCGDSFIPWRTFTWSWVEFFADHFTKVQGMNRRLAPPVDWSPVLPLRSWRRTNIDLKFALALTGSSCASDPRDKIYALLGLIDKGAGQHIIVDYTIAPCTVFLEATLAVIKDWKHDKAAIRERKLEDLLSHISKRPTSSQRLRSYKAQSKNHWATRCRAVAYLHQYVRFMLFYSNHLDVDLPTSSIGPGSCDGEKCGSWVAMYKATTIQEDDAKLPWGWAALGLAPAY
jgi:hypothetical protein